MKKILATALLGLFAASCGQIASASPFNLVNPASESGRVMAPLQEYEFEKKETLDFKNNPEQYKKRRDKKNKYLDYQEGKLDLTPDVMTRYQMQNSGPGTSNLQFIKGDDGQIKIKGF